MNKKYLIGMIGAVIVAGIILVAIMVSQFGDYFWKQQSKEFTFAMLPQMSNAQLAEAWRPLIAEIEAETGLKINQVFPKDFDEYIKWAKEGKIDFGYSNPFVYIQATPKPGEREHGHNALAIAVGKEGAVFYGEFIVRADNEKIKEFKDIKGKNGWIVDYSSAGGYLYEKGYAFDRGIDLSKDCALTVSSGSKQENVIMAVYNRQTDFGCVRNGIREKLNGRIDLSQIKVLAETERYPAWLFSVYDGVDAEVAEKMKAALLKISPEVFKVAALPGDVQSFQEATDKDFDSVRKLAEKLGMKY